MRRDFSKQILNLSDTDESEVGETSKKGGAFLLGCYSCEVIQM